MPAPLVTRLAPSPTGQLHVGNAWAFLICWLAARSSFGQVILRIEDIDLHRSRKEYINAIMEDLAWLGLDWDKGPDTECRTYMQSSRMELYAAMLEQLRQKKLVYPCFCSRKELMAMASAPHAGENAGVYPGTCANLPPDQAAALIAGGRQHCMRLRCNMDSISFYDRILGPVAFECRAWGGDFPLLRADGIWAYQFATAIDDALMGVNLVVRGNDLLDSTPRQIQVLKSLELRIPDYAHIPLLLSEDGERLAKRHRSLSLAQLRANGVDSRSLVGILAKLMGINPAGEPLSPHSLVDRFSLEKLPKQDIRLGKSDMGIL